MPEILQDYTSEFPRLKLFYADQVLYSQFRAREQQLVSVLDKGKHDALHRVIALEAYEDNIGMTSFTLHENSMRPDKRKHYARVDLVIVPDVFRGLGASKIVVLACLIDLLREFGDRIYSISCLAGHDAIAHILSQLGFTENRQKKDDFRHFEQKVSDDTSSELFAYYDQQLKYSLQSTNYKCRQRQ